MKSEKHSAAARQNLENWRQKVKRGEAKPPKSGKHGILSLLRTGKAKNPRVRRAIEAYGERMVEEFGGEKNLTPGQFALIETQKTLLGVILLSTIDIMENGIVADDEGATRPVVKATVAYSNALRQNQLALQDMAKESTPGKRSTLDKTLAEIAAEKDQEEND